MKCLLPCLLFFVTHLLTQAAYAQTFTLSGPELICDGTSAPLTATGCMGTVQWSTGETTASIIIFPTTSTLYSVTCTEGENQPQTIYHAVGVFPKPPLTVSTPNPCANENVTLSTNTMEYTHSDVGWKRDGLPIVSGGGSYIANQAGTYTVEDTVARGAWVPYPSIPAGGVYRTFSFVDENNGWAIAGRQKVVRTENGGKTWLETTNTLNLAPGDSLVDVIFTDATTGWICANGKIVKTSDGGATWNIQHADAKLIVHDLFFLNSQRGWAVGGRDAQGYGYFDESTLLATTDGGTTWQRISLPSRSVIFSKVQFISSSVGWAINDDPYKSTLYKTTNGGATWISQISNYGSLTNMYFHDANNGWLYGNRFLAKTSDGGATWSSYMNYSPFEYLNSPLAVGIAKGVIWIFEPYTTYYSVDGGKSWIRSDPKHPSVNHISIAAAFLPSGKVLVAGATGTLTKYIPKTQSCLSSVTILPTLPAPKITPSTTAALCQGESITLTASGCAGTLGWSNGATEAAITIAPTATTSYSAFCEGDNGCRSTVYQGVAVVPRVQLDTASSAPCYRPVLTSTQVWADMDLCWKKDGQLLDYRDTGPYVPQNEGTFTTEVDSPGAWQPQAPTRSGSYHEPGYPITYLKDVQFINDSTGFIVGGGRQFLRTTDGGKTWIAAKIPAFSDQFSGYRLHFVDANQGWVSGSFNDMEWYGEVLRTIDGGLSWDRVRLGTLGSGAILNDLFFVKTPAGDPAGWGVGSLGRIVNSFDGGLTWTQQKSNTTVNLKTVFFLDDHTGWAGGASGTLLTTTNGGFTWTPSTIANVSDFESLQFLDASRGWAVAVNTDNGLYHTSDGGATWTKVPVDASHPTYLMKVQFLNDSTGFVQSNKFIHATTDGGATWTKSYHHLNTGGMSFTDLTHGWVIGGSIMAYVSASSVCRSEPVTVLPESITPLSTLTSGSWNTPDVWSCGEIPTALDAVRINSGHTIALPDGYSAKARSVEIQGEVQPGLNAGLQLGQD